MSADAMGTRPMWSVGRQDPSDRWSSYADTARPMWSVGAQDPRGYRGLVDPADYPSRDTALTLVNIFGSSTWHTTGDLDRLAGVEDFLVLAQHCWEVYGYPSLEPAARARRVAERFLEARPELPSLPRKGVEERGNDLSRPSTPETPSAPPPFPSADTYGFTPRA